jgi:hypothetical protein
VRKKWIWTILGLNLGWGIIIRIFFFGSLTAILPNDFLWCYGHKDLQTWWRCGGEQIAVAWVFSLEAFIIPVLVMWVVAWRGFGKRWSLTKVVLISLVVSFGLLLGKLCIMSIGVPEKQPDWETFLVNWVFRSYFLR